MDTTVQTRSTARSVRAVLAGLVVIAATSHATDAALQALGIFPAFGTGMSDAQFALAAVYRTLFGIFGCYLTARLAPQRPLFHAMILGGIGTVISSLGVVATLSQGVDLGPLWYSVLLVLTALPSAWLAARVHQQTVAA